MHKRSHKHIKVPCLFSWVMSMSDFGGLWRHQNNPVWTKKCHTLLTDQVAPYTTEEKKKKEAQSKSTRSWKPVKHDQSWSPNGWVTVMCSALRMPWDLFRVKICADSTIVPYIYIYMHTKRSRTHVKDPVRSPCQSLLDYGNNKITQHALKNDSNGQLCGRWSFN